MMTYQQQIKDPRWQKKRLEVLESYKFECQECQANDQELHVHHPFYRRGAMIWEYEAEELMCLCHRCHKEAHAIDEKIRQALAEMNHSEKMRFLGYLDAGIGPCLRMETVEYQEGYADHMRGSTRVLIRTHIRAYGV